jgi:hypothetical protein
MKRKFTFENKTPYFTKDVRKIVLRVAKDVAGKSGPPNLRVVLVSTKKGQQQVRFWRHKPGQQTGCFELILPDGGVDPALLAVDTAWALARIQGCQNRDLNGIPRYDRHNAGYPQFYAWAAALNVARPNPGKLTGAALALKRAEQCQENMDKWEAKLKKAERMVKKWRKKLHKKLHYYENRAEKLQKAWTDRLFTERQQGS